MGKIILYDDQPEIIKKLKTGIRKVDLTPIVFTELERLREYIYSDQNWDEMQALIFDLAQAMEVDDENHNYAIIADILYCYENRRIPILIHSAYAELVEKLQNLPGVFLYKKGGLAIRQIRTDLGIMKNSGFLDLFSEGPMLADQTKRMMAKTGKSEKEIKLMFHKEFRDVFAGHDIVAELSQILKEFEDPVRECFTRFFEPARERIAKSN